MEPLNFNEERYLESKLSFGDEIRIASLVELSGRGDRVLDVACLDGWMGSRLKKNYREVYGIDASKPAVEKAISKGIRARVGNLEEPLPFESEMFDGVVAGEIIEHIFDVDLFLKEIHRVLKPGGSLSLSTPNLAAFGRRFLLLFNRNPHIEISFKGDAAGHIRYFIRQTLMDLLETHGFEIQVFTSDVVNFTGSGNLRSIQLARLMPTLGRCLIVKAIKK